MHVADPDIVAGMSQRQLSSERLFSCCLWRECYWVRGAGEMLEVVTVGSGVFGWRLGWVEGGGQWVWVGEGGCVSG